ncbi:MAG: NUMOD4 domain-containing protein [Brumimicrobium sp.]
MDEKEKWKDIPGFSDYEISNLGRIRSKERVKKYNSGRVIQLKSKLKQQRKHPKNGFMMTDLINNKGKRKTVYPHKAVAMAFIKNYKPRKQKVVLHKDDNLSNNKVDNLKWATYSQSIKRGFETGKRDNSDLWAKRRAKYGIHGSSKPMGRKDPLSKEDHQKIYQLRKKDKVKLATLAEQFNCSVSHIHKTISRIEKTNS